MSADELKFAHAMTIKHTLMSILLITLVLSVSHPSTLAQRERETDQTRQIK